MSNSCSQDISLEEFASMPDWARSQPRDPKVTRALVSTATRRSELLRSLLSPGHLIHCYGKTGFGIDPWLTRFLTSTPEHCRTYDLSRIIVNEPFDEIGNIVQWLHEQAVDHQHNAGTHEPPLQVLLLRLDKHSSSFCNALLAALSTHCAEHTLILSSCTAPPTWSLEYTFRYTLFHIGEHLLQYSVQDYEKLTTRWPSKPSTETIQAIIDQYDGWPEPCLRSLCEVCDLEETQGNWLPGHQWIATLLYSLPLDELQLLLTAHAQPIITPEGLDLCEEPIHNVEMAAHGSQENGTLPSYNQKRRYRSAMLSQLSHQLLLQQLTHPRLHFRWCTQSLQRVLQRMAQEKPYLQILGLKQPATPPHVNLRLCQLYLEHDYIQEIVKVCNQAGDLQGLQYLIEQQPGRVIDYLRGISSSISTIRDSHAHFFNSMPYSMQLTQQLQSQFYWTQTELPPATKAESNTESALEFKAITALINHYEDSRNALVKGHLADGLIKLEQVFLNAVDERCFTIAGPCLALIALTDFFCMNKKHLRKILQNLDHAEALMDPESHLLLVDWADICVTPLQLISSHGPAIAKRLQPRISQNLAGVIPEESYLFYRWAHCLAILLRGDDQQAAQFINNVLTRIASLYRQMQEVHCHTAEANQPVSPGLLLRPWVASFLFLRLLNDLQTNGRLSPRDLQNLLKQSEQFYVIIRQEVDQSDLWSNITLVITRFIKAMQSKSKDQLDDLAAVVDNCRRLEFRLIWVYGALLYSAALWYHDREAESLEQFFTAIEFAQNAGLHDILSPLTELLHPQIRRAKQHNRFTLLIERALNKIEHKTQSKNNRLEHLSKRELEILGFINQGMSNEDIADHLCRAKGTVKLHVHNIYKKLQIKNRVEAIKLYNQYQESVQTV